MGRGSAKPIPSGMIDNSTFAILASYERSGITEIEYHSFLMQVTEHLCNENPERTFGRNYGRLVDTMNRIRFRISRIISEHPNWLKGSMSLMVSALEIEDDDEVESIISKRIPCLRRVKNEAC